MTIAESPIEWLDRARSGALAIVARTPLLPLIAKRDARAKARAAVAIVLALVLTALCPALALAISPALLGVPHIAAAVRYLILRQNLPRGFLVATVALAGAMMALRVLEQYSGTPARFASGEIVIAMVWALAAAGAAFRSGGNAWRFVLASIGIVALASLALLHPLSARIGFAHVHNLGVVVLWLLGFRRGGFPLWIVALLFVAIALLLSGTTVALAESAGGTAAAGVDLREVGKWLVPGAAASIAMPLVLAHVFTDSVHYAFWLGVIPDETLTHQGSLSFRMTMRSLVRDFGKVGLGAIAALTAFVLIASLADHTGTRNAYFAIAGFHGYIEGVMIVYWGVFPRGARIVTG